MIPGQLTGPDPQVPEQFRGLEPLPLVAGTKERLYREVDTWLTGP